MKNGILFSLNTLLGGMFIISAYLKFDTLEFFELNLVDTGVISWGIAPFAARTIIAIELLAGLLVLFQYRLQDFTLRIAIGLLCFFTGYLVIVLILKGNSENCNCFGGKVYMSPVQAISKNVVFLTVSVVLLKYFPGFQWKKSTWLLAILSITSFAAPYSLDPVAMKDTGQVLSDKSRYQLDLSKIYSDPAVITPSVELRKGKHIVACLSLKCSHCILAAYKLHLVKEKNPDLSIYFLVNGKIKDIPHFLWETRAYNVPQTLVLGSKFIDIAGHQIPAVFFLENGYVVRKINYLQIDQEEIESWMNMKDE